MNENIEVQQVRRNNRNRHLFRQLAHEVTRAVYDPPEGHVLFFAYHHQYKPNTLAGVGCCERGQHPSNHSIMYLFVKSFYQKRGIGKYLLTSMEDYLLRDSSQNIEIEAAGKAVGFFEKQGYSLVGEPVKPAYCGSDLFRTLQKMEKVVTSSPQHEFTYEDWNP